MNRTDIYTKIIAAVLFLAFAFYIVSWLWNSTNENIKTEPVQTYAISDSDEASRNVELYECYIRLDYNNDGKMENLIVHCVGNVLLSVQENKPGIAPFFVAQAIQDASMIFNSKVSYLQELEQMQDLKTALIRQVIISVAKANIPQKYLKENTVDPDAVMAGDEWIFTKDNPSDVVYIPPVNQISPVTFDLVNYAQNDIEANSGSTRYNQGLDANSLNKTATGIKAIMGASEKKIKLLARRISENFLCPVFRYLIILNQIYMKPQEMFRLLNDNVAISREELDIDYDLIVDIGGGPGTKEAQIQYLMYLIQSLYPILEQRGIVDGSGWHSAAKDLLEQLGLKGTSSYLIDPDSPEGKQKIQATQKAIEKQKQDERQFELDKIKTKADADLERAKVPRLGVYYSELPVDTQKQFAETQIVAPRRFAHNLQYRIGTMLRSYFQSSRYMAGDELTGIFIAHEVVTDTRTDEGMLDVRQLIHRSVYIEQRSKILIKILTYCRLEATGARTFLAK